MLAACTIQAFVVSLAHAQKRRQNISRDLDGRITYEFIEAISGLEVKANQKLYCKSASHNRYLRDLTHNEIACSASHRKALIRFLETGAKYGLILEDDALIPEANFQKMLDAADAIGEFDLLKLGGLGPFVAEGVINATVGGVNVLAVITFGSCTHGYIVTQSGAEKLIPSILPVREPYDNFLRNNYEHKCRIFETSPWLVSLQNEAFDSTIGGGRTLKPYSYSVIRNIAATKDRIRYNVKRHLFNLRRFGLAYITRSGFTKRMPSGD